MSQPVAGIHLHCPRCDRDAFVIVPENAAPAASGVQCPRCGFLFPGSTSEIDPSRPLLRCAVCAGQEFYVQKDFNRSFGLAVVAVTAVAAFVVMVLAGHLWGFLVLGAITLADLVVYRFLPEVEVCYLCQSVYRGFPLAPEHRGFYLGNEERYKALRRAWLEGLSR